MENKESLDLIDCNNNKSNKYDNLLLTFLICNFRQYCKSYKKNRKGILLDKLTKLYLDKNDEAKSNNFRNSDPLLNSLNNRNNSKRSNRVNSRQNTKEKLHCQG